MNLAYLKQETTEKVLVRPEFNDNKSLHGTWSSYDKNVHKVVIPVIPQTGLGFDMTEIVSVQVYLKFANGAYGPFAGQIEDPEQRTVSFTVPEEVRGQTGTVSISVMLNLTEDRQIDLVRFTATARLSDVDKDTEVIGKYYVPLFENLVKSVQGSLDEDVAQAKISISQAVSETQGIAREEQIKIQAELPRVQENLNGINAKVIDTTQKVDELKQTLRLHKGYKMADGTFIKKLPPVNLFHTKYLASNVVDVALTNTGFKKNTTNKTNGWATPILGNTELMKFLKPNKKYTITYEYKILTRDTQGVKYINDAMGTMNIYSGVNNTTYPTIRLASGDQGLIKELADKKVGDVLKRNATFTTPANFDDPTSNYRIIFYTMRGVDEQNVEVLKEAGEFINIKISESDDNVVYTTNPDSDPLNAYPKWQGLALKDSDDLNDYQWQLSDEYISRLKPAWKMANGMWGKVYPRENLWIKKLLINGYISNANGSIIQTTSNPQHKVMNARTAVPPGKLLVWQCWNPDRIVNNSNFTRIAWYKSDNSFISWDAITPLKGEEYLTKTFIPPAGATQCRLSTIVGTPDNKENTNIKHKFEVINQGEEPSIFSAAPTDDLLNAYPKYKGLAVDLLDNEADYLWQQSDEYRDYKEEQLKQAILALGGTV